MQVLQRQNILHRGLTAALCLALVVSVAAQRPARKSKGPRALALVEWPAGGGSPRVIPVAILVDGQFYDASIYKADPVPMALESGNVYEVEQSGESIGMATLTEARQTGNGAWLADARFQTNEQLAAARKAREARDAPKPATVPEGPPVLRRGRRRSASDKTPQTAPEPKPEPPPSEGDEPPVLRKPPAQTPPLETKPSQPASPVPAAPSPPSTVPQPEDTDHPVLRRGRPTAEQAENLPGALETKAAPRARAAAAGRSSPAKKTAAAPGRVLAAISDADGPEPRSFALPWKAEDLEKLKAAMIQAASAALEDWARAHGGSHPGKLQDVQVRAFDLNISNEPQLVLMARAAEAPAAPVRRAGAKAGTARGAAPAASDGLTYWITLAARQDYNGELRKLKVWATDSKHLDAYPRAELIDAVDADGNGRGELLFREISDLGRSFVLYRATADTLTQLYNSSELEQY
jgi:outer membrane biosynthesis protein TonB